MSRESQAVELLHRVMGCAFLYYDSPETIWRRVDLVWADVIGDIEAFLTDIEAEKRDALRK